MNRLIAIDPGNKTGWAQFDDGVLTAAGCKEFDAHWGDFGLSGSLPWQGLVLIEEPQWRPNEARDVNALLKLARKVGWFERHFVRLVKVDLVMPVAWKGSVDKKVHNRRVLSRLSPQELAVLPKSPRAKSYDNNMVDAVGLGLWKLGRMHGRAGT